MDLRRSTVLGAGVSSYTTTRRRQRRPLRGVTRAWVSSAVPPALWDAAMHVQPSIAYELYYYSEGDNLGRSDEVHLGIRHLRAKDWASDGRMRCGYDSRYLDIGT